MNSSGGGRITAASVLLWVARLSGTAVVVLLMLFAFGEQVHPPRWHPTWQGACAHRSHCNQLQKGRVQRLYVCAKSVIHTIVRLTETPASPLA